MFSKQTMQNMPSFMVPSESEISFEETDLKVYQRQVSTVFDSLHNYNDWQESLFAGYFDIFTQNADFGTQQSIVAAVKNLVDVVRISGTYETKLTESDYNSLVAILDDLVDLVREDEGHILAPLMELIGRFIETYEDEHIPELAMI